MVGESFDVERGEFNRRRHNSPLRAVAARMLVRYAGLSQREVANELAIGSGAAVCNQLARLTDRLAEDRPLRRQVEAVEKWLVVLRHEKRAGLQGGGTGS